MDENDEIIGKWLQQEMSDDEVMPDEDCSDVEPDLVEYAVQVEDCESESEIEGDDDEISVQDSLSQPEPTVTVSSRPGSSSRTSNETDSSDEDIPLSQKYAATAAKNCESLGIAILLNLIIDV